MTYSNFAIEQLKVRLLEKSIRRNNTPKKYAGDMLEAYEVIKQLQDEILTLRKYKEAYDNENYNSQL